MLGYGIVGKMQVGQSFRDSASPLKAPVDDVNSASPIIRNMPYFP